MAGRAEQGKTLFRSARDILSERVGAKCCVRRTSQPVGCESYVSISRPKTTACMHVNGPRVWDRGGFFRADQNVPESQIGFFARISAPIPRTGLSDFSGQDRKPQQPHQLQHKIKPASASPVLVRAEPDKQATT